MKHEIIPTAENIKLLTAAAIVPKNIFEEIAYAAKNGKYFTELPEDYFTLDSEYALRLLGYSVFHDRVRNKYIIRW